MKCKNNQNKLIGSVHYKNMSPSKKGKEGLMNSADAEICDTKFFLTKNRPIIRH